MSAPRLEIRLDRIEHNARTLVDRLRTRGITVTGVTKASLGSAEVAHAMLRGGVTGIGDSRIENIERLRAAGVPGPMTLIRSPMLSQVARVVAHAETSCNTEPQVIDALAAASLARGRTHGVVLMVELGDLREGILPADLVEIARRTLGHPGVELRGIGANLACQSGVAPSDRNMARLSDLVAAVESSCGIEIAVVSGGNSANLDWAFATADAGRIDNLRLGESILLGCEPLRRTPIDGLHLDAVTFVAEVIESKVKPLRPWGERHENAFGARTVERGRVGGESTGSSRARRAIVALGEQDTDPAGLSPPAGMVVVGASSDHLVLDVGPLDLAVGHEVRFGLDYRALLRAMTSPFVGRSLLGGPTPG